MSENYPAHERLDSWKEIAAYLNRDVRTAIRWEKERGLPVRRVPGGHKQAVFAYREQIDAWLVGRSENGVHPRPPAAPPRPSQVESPQIPQSIAVIPAGPDGQSLPRNDRRTSWRNLLLVAAFLAALALGFWAVLTSVRRPRFVSLQRITDDDRGKLYLQTDGKTVYFAKTEGARMVLASAPAGGGAVRTIDTPFNNVTVEDLSSDGAKLLVLAYEGINVESQPWVVPLYGGTPQRIGDTPCHTARWSPDNRKIACAHDTTIMLMEADGSGVRTVASLSSPVARILWNPDGSRLRYVLYETATNTNSQWEIEIDGNGKGGPPQRLPFGPNCCFDWAWAPDGKTFVVVESSSNGKSRLMLQDGHSSPAIELPVNIGRIWAIAPGKHGHSIFLVIETASGGDLLKFDPARKTFQSYLPGLSAAYISFSGDGQWITYSSDLGGPLWRSKADGGEAFRLVKHPMEALVSSWSPDGRRIAFMGRKPDQPWRIYLTGRDGGAIEEASEGDDNQGGPSWSPDGSEIVYGNVYCEKTQDCWVRRINLATRKAEIIPGSNGLRTARWSPDGKYIAALRFMTRELMLYDLRARKWSVLAGDVSGDNVNWSSDSQYIYVDSPKERNPVVERVRVRDHKRYTVAGLDFLQKAPGQINGWMGLTPDNSPIVSHMFTASEIYKLKWSDR